ncbi:NAD-dependent epimerase/dehydratase family protein [Pseudomonas alliivorans]|uniref:NAD-dependent epimerase/dehydratase family protein n=1 Tax=Pseudomonas alliivorans TaxID=2810613 RepID=UPI001AE387AC|nr:NAD-dependent epimerase/dehydratase family protein [Pseudomonas alliivorans]MBP0952512.1 NAD-dependent epimerase/dehydratase family protein [Pseudomonas alliivorans]MEE4574874.1 NAD-dependent epimerase/dehydratase family protein [Pseudomonas alliivorans]MEE4672322.1 NAD-dependent epimerase/dehydratase family protein [Pseudomonas alliivorans]MEE5039624.1 NAD-dependent epimerase/dehydratase family protein [Pseudomonas alliivorans]MEE5061478.1 NAD-dependent epimerase/dehydratase family protein
MEKVCFVTGGAGFIGCALSASLAKRYSKVIAIDNMHPQIHSSMDRPALLDPAVELVVADVTLPATWEQLLAKYKPTVVYHLAAETGTGQSLLESSRHAEVNILGTTRMLDAFSAHDVRPDRIILTSSRAVYGEGGWEDPKGQVTYPGQRTNEMLGNSQWDFPGLKAVPFQSSSTLTYPTSIYGVTKLSQEQLISCWADAHGVKTSILRLQNVYGVGQSLTNPYTGIVSLFAQLAKAKKSIPLYEDGEVVRDFVYISDVANALVLAADSSEKNFTYDVGSGRSITIRELATIISDRYSAPAPEVCGKYRNGDVRFASCRIDETSVALNWAPEVTVEQGVNMLCDWIDSSAVRMTL